MNVRPTVAPSMLRWLARPIGHMVPLHPGWIYSAPWTRAARHRTTTPTAASAYIGAPAVQSRGGVFPGDSTAALANRRIVPNRGNRHVAYPLIQCISTRRWDSSSSSNAQPPGYDDSAAAAEPDPSALSEEDLKLAIHAASQPDGSSPLDTHLSDIPGAEKGGKKLAIVFTCTVCDTRSAKKFTEHAYNHGVVMVRCPGCQNYHLVADRLGFFGDKTEGGWDVQKAMERMGENVKAVTDDNVLELTMGDILGKERAEALGVRQEGKREEEKHGKDRGNNKDGQR